MRRRSTDELLEIWYVHNREQWTEGAFDAIRLILEERGVAVPALGEVGAAARPSAGTEFEQIVTLTGFATQGEAQLARAILEAGGIEALVVSEVAYRLSAGQPIRLQVRDCDAARAAELLGLDIGYATELEAAVAPAGRGTELAATRAPGPAGTQPGPGPAVPAPEAGLAEADVAQSALDWPAVGTPHGARSPQKPIVRGVALLMLVAMLLSVIDGAWRTVADVIGSRPMGF